jgi:hypothetical protein
MTRRSVGSYNAKRTNVRFSRISSSDAEITEIYGLGMSLSKESQGCNDASTTDWYVKTLSLVQKAILVSRMSQ